MNVQEHANNIRQGYKDFLEAGFESDDAKTKVAESLMVMNPGFGAKHWLYLLIDFILATDEY